MTCWYCDICDKTINFKSKSRHLKTNSHKQNVTFNTLFKVYDFDKLNNNEIDYIISNCVRHCYNIYFHTFKYICIYDIETSKVETCKHQMIYRNLVSGIITDKKFKNLLEKNDFINKLTIKTYSKLSYKKIPYYLKLQIPILHRKFFKILSHNQEYIEFFCDDDDNLFHFACRRWYWYNIPQY